MGLEVARDRDEVREARHQVFAVGPNDLGAVARIRVPQGVAGIRYRPGQVRAPPDRRSPPEH